MAWLLEPWLLKWSLFKFCRRGTVGKALNAMGGVRCKWPPPSTGKPVKEKGKQPNQPGVSWEGKRKDNLGRKTQLQGGHQTTPSGEPFPMSHVPSGAQSHFGRDLLYSCTLYLSNDEILNELLFPTHPSVPNCCFPMQPAHVRYMPMCLDYDWQPARYRSLGMALPGLTGWVLPDSGSWPLFILVIFHWCFYSGWHEERR